MLACDRRFLIYCFIFNGIFSNFFSRNKLANNSANSFTILHFILHLGQMGIATSNCSKKLKLTQLTQVSRCSAFISCPLSLWMFWQWLAGRHLFLLSHRLYSITYLRITSNAHTCTVHPHTNSEISFVRWPNVEIFMFTFRSRCIETATFFIWCSHQTSIDLPVELKADKHTNQNCIWSDHKS